MDDVNESLDFAERWLRDGLRILTPSLFIQQVEVDMLNAQALLETFREKGVEITYTHLIVKVTALTLARHPQLHQIIAGARRHRPDRIEVGLSVTGETFVAPVLTISRADEKPIEEIAAEIRQRAPEIRQADRKLLSVVRRWGWLVPFGFMRRALLRLAFLSPMFRRKGVGTFQVTSLPNVDWVAPANFSTAGILVGARVRPRVVARDGQAVVRPIMLATLCGDHGVWQGSDGATFLGTFQALLESCDELVPTPPRP